MISHLFSLYFQTNLDGMFGVLTRHLHRLVDGGASFKNATELYNLVAEHPLKHSEFHLFLPQRSLINWKVDAKLVEKLGSYYFLEYNTKTGNTIGKIHSRHSMGTQLTQLNTFINGKSPIEKKKEKLKAMSVPELREKLKKLKLDQTGVKKVLIDRLTGDIPAVPSETSSPPNESE